METKIEPTGRLEIEADGDLMFWIKIDGKTTDLVMLSELRTISDISAETKEGIDQIYEDIKLAKVREEE